jgi:hypothetical protein
MALMDRPNDAAGARGSKGGLGDDQGTRVGKPEPGPIRPAAHHHGDTGRPERHLGLGSEPSEAVHNAKQAKSGESRDEQQPTALEGQKTGTDQPGGRAGSEPLADRKHEHRSGYGGAGGDPVESSDKRK